MAPQLPGRGKRRDTGLRRTGRPAKVAGRAEGLRPRTPPLGARANRRRVAVLPIVTHTPTPPHIAPFSAPLHTETGEQPSNRQAAARARRAKPGAKGAGKAERSECRAREDYGWGWAGRCKQAVPRTPTQHPPPHPPAAARARRAKPGAKRRQGGAQRLPRQGGLRVGVGGAVQSNLTTQPTQPPAPKHPRQHKPNAPPPSTRGSASPNGEARRERAANRERSDVRGWAGGVTKTAPKIPADPDAAQTPLETRRRSPARCSTPLRLPRCPASRCDRCGSPVQLRPVPWRPPRRHARL